MQEVEFIARMKDNLSIKTKLVLNFCRLILAHS